MAEQQIVVFSLNNELCGADTSQVQEIVKYQEIAKLPEMPDFVEGIINLRGKVIPVINLNQRFGLGTAEITKKTKIIITSLDQQPVGFIVNDVSEILKFSPEDMETAPELIGRVGNSYLKSVGKKGDKLVSILDLSKILSEIEVNKLK